MTELQEQEDLKDVYANLHQLLEGQEYEKLQDELFSMEEVEVAEFLSQVEVHDAFVILNRFEPEFKAEVFANFDRYLQKSLVEYFSPKELAVLLTDMSSDDRVDLFQNLNVEIQDKILPYLHKAERDDIINLSSYPPKTAGAVMSSDYATISLNMTVEKAINKIRKDAPSKETIYYIYVVNDEQTLTGIVSLRKLIMSGPKDTIASIMKEDAVFAYANDDQEDVMKKIEKYDLIAIPVVNAENQLVGIITHDDAMDIMRQEQTEDMEKFMGISGEHRLEAYLKTSVWQHFKSRAFWINVLAALGIISGLIIQQFGATIQSLFVLMLYIPMMSSAGGNSGSQSATVVIRAIALGEISSSDWLIVLYKEFKVSLLLGLSLGLWIFLKVVFFDEGNHILPIGLTYTQVGTSIALALAVQVITATVLGAVLPLIAFRFKQDPAVIASPVLSTIVDITGLLLYFTTARIVLGI